MTAPDSAYIARVARLFAVPRRYLVGSDALAFAEHTCGPWCDIPEPYQGPILLGRRGEPVTPGRGAAA